MNPFNKIVFYDINYYAGTAGQVLQQSPSGKPVWVAIDPPSAPIKREPIRSDRDWQSLPCCGGLYTRGICNIHNCPPENK